MSRHIGATKLYIICIKKGRGYIPKKWNNIKKNPKKNIAMKDKYYTKSKKSMML